MLLLLLLFQIWYLTSGGLCAHRRIKQAQQVHADHRDEGQAEHRGEHNDAHRPASVRGGFAHYLPGKADGRISENLTAAAVPWSVATGYRRRGSGCEIGMHLDIW